MTIKSLQDLLTNIQVQFPGCRRPVIIIQTNKADVDHFKKLIAEFINDPNSNLIEYSGEQTIGKIQQHLSLVFHNGKIQIEENGE